MNAASQLLRILAIVGALAAGALYYLSTKPGAMSSITGGGTAAGQPDKLAAVQAEAAKNAQALSDAQADAATADSARAQALAAVDDLTKKLHDETNASSDKDTQIADLTTKVGSVDDLQKQIDDLKTQNAQLQQQIAAGPAPAAGSSPTDNGNGGKGSTSTTTASAPAPVQLTPAAPAKILGIDTKQWLLVLNVGTGDGVQKDSQLQLKVGDADIGTVVVRDSQNGLSTAAITSTGGISQDDYSKIVKKNLNVQFQRVM